MNRGRAARRRAKRRRENAIGCEANVEPIAIDATERGEIDHPHGLVAPPPEISETAFAPEGSGEPSANRDRWLEIKAVRERYPVSRGMLERLSYEGMTIFLNPEVPTRERLNAGKLLVAMATANHSRGQLPEQVSPLEVNNVRIDIGSVVRELIADDRVLEAIDMRPFKPERGGPDDYAE